MQKAPDCLRIRFRQTNGRHGKTSCSSDRDYATVFCRDTETTRACRFGYKDRSGRRFRIGRCSTHFGRRMRRIFFKRYLRNSKTVVMLWNRFSNKNIIPIRMFRFMKKKIKIITFVLIYLIQIFYNPKSAFNVIKSILSSNPVVSNHQNFLWAINVFQKKFVGQIFLSVFYLNTQN